MYSDGHSEEDLSIMPIEEITASDKGTYMYLSEQSHFWFFCLCFLFTIPIQSLKLILNTVHTWPNP